MKQALLPFLLAIVIAQTVAIATLAISPLSKPPSPTGRDQVEKPNQEAAGDKGAAEINQPQAGRPNIIRTTDAQNAQQAAPQNQNNGQNKPPENRWLAPDGATAIFTGFLFLVGIGQVVLFWRQLVFIRKGLADTKETADAAKESADTGKRALELSQRAILTTDDWDLRPDGFGPNLRPQFVFNLINSGKTPAETTHAIFRARTDERLPEISDAKPLTPYIGFVPPNSKLLIIPARLDPISPANFQEIVNGRYYIFMYGRIVYKDIFDKYFELGFAVKCFFLKDQAGNIIPNQSPRFEIPQIPGYSYLIERKEPKAGEPG
jgi:hypothetical protein